MGLRLTFGALLEPPWWDLRWDLACFRMCALHKRGGKSECGGRHFTQAGSERKRDFWRAGKWHVSLQTQQPEFPSHLLPVVSPVLKTSVLLFVRISLELEVTGLKEF